MKLLVNGVALVLVLVLVCGVLAAADHVGLIELDLPADVEAGVADVLDGSTEVLGEGEGRFLVSDEASRALAKCTPVEVLANGKCGDLPAVMFSARRMPFITRNISKALREGKPGILTRATKEQAKVNRRAVCGSTFKRVNGGSCDEYPVASSMEGGEGARAEEVPGRENQCQGGTLGGQYTRHGIDPGDQFVVVILYPDEIAEAPFTGTDIAKERGACAV